MADELTKKRVGIVNRPGVTNSTDPGTAVKVIAEKTGIVTTFDQIKVYYHTLISLSFGLIALLNWLAANAHWIPSYGTTIAGWISVAIMLLTPIATKLKSNEHWVDDL